MDSGTERHVVFGLQKLIMDAKADHRALNKLIVTSWEQLEEISEVDSNWKKQYLSMVNSIHNIYGGATAENRELNDEELQDIGLILDRMLVKVKLF